MKITNQRGAGIPKEFMGLFIEDINYAIDGGLYAQLLENRNFESLDLYGSKECGYYGKHDGLFAWSGDGLRLEVVQGSPVSENSPHYLRAAGAQGGGRFQNSAYGGLCLRPGVACQISFYARCARYQGSITVGVMKAGAVLLSETVPLCPTDADGWNRWVKYELSLCPETEISGGQFFVQLEHPGTVEFDWFSMLPEDAVLGIFRRDLAEALKALRPGFLRFPGGCIVEGNTLSNRYRFQDTLGPVEDRKFNWNRWAVEGNSEANRQHGAFAHYGQTYGVGFYEYFLLCEYLGAKPLPVLGVGLACQYQSYERIELEDPLIQEYIQDYLDLIEFANGSQKTRWGAVRCRMGHPEPFGLEMVGVGNEQWETPESRFFERYALFEREIHRVYPDIKLIGTAGPELDSPRFQAAWKFYRENEGKRDFVYAVDEHSYSKPEWFLTHCDYFDHVSRETKVFFGEYAAHADIGTVEKIPQRNTLESALAEAAFLTGMARNSDAVVMTCYAPLLARIGYAQWSPNLIWFDGKRVCRTPSYYVQQMFAENLGDYNIGIAEGEIPCQASYDAAHRELVLMLVNGTGESKEIPVSFDSQWDVGKEPVQEILLTGEGRKDCNLPGKETVQPAVRRLSLPGTYRMPPFSFAVLRIPAVRK